MADIHDQALEWAQANSQDPRAQDIMAKAWAAKNPQDPRSAQIMARFNQQQPSLASKAIDFAKSLPTSAVDLIPGMKDQRLANEQYRSAHANDPSDIPGMTQGQRADSFKQTAEADANDPINMVGEAPIWGMAKGIPGLQKLFAGPVRRAELAPIMKDVKQLEPYVAGQIQKARQGFNEMQIAPRMLEQKAMLQGSDIKIRPEDYRGISPELDKLMDSIRKPKIDPYGTYDYSPGVSVPGRPNQPAEFQQSVVIGRPESTPGYGNYTRSGDMTVGGSVRDIKPEEDLSGLDSYLQDPKARPDQVPQSRSGIKYGYQEDPQAKFDIIRGESSPAIPGTESSRVPGQEQQYEEFAVIPAEKALEIRGLLNDNAGWKMHPLDPSKAQAVNSRAAALHQDLTSKFGNINPGANELSQEMQSAYGLEKNALGNAKRPINTVTNKGLTQRSRLAQFDEAAGSNLSQLGQDINTLNERTKNPLLSINTIQHPIRTGSAQLLKLGDTLAAPLGRGIATPVSDQMTGLAKLAALLGQSDNKDGQ